MEILVAGGAGFIGTHTCLSLLQAGHRVIVVDSLINSRIENLRRVQEIAGKRLEFVEADCRERRSLDAIFSNHRIGAVINLAGHKAVGESVEMPLDYYDNNLNCAISLVQCMARHDVKVMVFSSSAAVYGESAVSPITEDASTEPGSPYGRTKLYIEEILKDVFSADNSWKTIILRYFNPVAAHPSGLIGEQSSGVPSNLFPRVVRVAAGEQATLNVFGDDYSTRDGTAIRDYIHVMDLALGHVRAIQKLETLSDGAVLTINLGTGKGYSVLEILQSFETVCGRDIPYQCVSRRKGDLACCYADPGLAKAVLDWEAELGLTEMCRDAWNWRLRCGDIS